jgi:NAD(P)-dependent dehydrogenase (short-subunit alcohol dehydrogenase family)
MDLQLGGKRAFVSGSSSGLGKAIALELAAEGCDVIVHGRDKARTEETAKEVARQGVKSAITTGDLTNESDAAKVCDEALAAFGAIDIVVNNCGLLIRKDSPNWSTLAIHEWIESLEVNFVSTVRVSQRLMPGMKLRNWGRLINISTAASMQVLNGTVSEYGSSKAALNKFTVDIAKDLGPYNITVNAIAPGTIRTPAVAEWMRILKEQHGWGDDPVENERIYTTKIFPQSVPRLGMVRDISTLTTFLASPLAGYINGTVIRVDGGMADYI